MAIEIPAWFDVDIYMANKLLQLNAVEPKANWTSESLTKAMEEAGYKGEEGAYQHFLDYGMNENISPNADFDVNFYLRSKADALNAVHYENKVWDAVSVMDAIKANGMHSAWEHYQLYGSQEGIATSAGFDSEAYFIAKVAQMNATKEDGRSNWGLDEVKGIFAEQGLSALEHYNLYGKDENVAKYGSFEATEPAASADGFDPYTGAQTYSLVKAIEAHTDGSLAATYALEDVNDAGTITVAEYNGLDALIAGASNAASLGKADPTYTLEDTVAAIDGASASAIAGSTGGKYNIADTLANVAAGNDALVNTAKAVTAAINFAATDKDKAVVTSVTYADIDGKDGATITIAHADGDTNAGNAVVVVDASAEKADTAINLSTLFDNTADNVTFNAVGSAQADTITAHAKGGVITGGKGADVMTAGTGADTFVFNAGDSGITAAEADTIKSFTVAGDSINLGLAGTAANTTIGTQLADNTFATALTAANSAFDGTVKIFAVEGSTADTWFVFYDSDADNSADMAIQLTGVTGDITAADFVA